MFATWLSIVLIIWLTVVKIKAKTNWYMVDMCWVVLYLAALLGLYLFIGSLTRPDAQVGEKVQDFMINGYFAFFGFALGPVGFYTATSCAMTFHNFEHVASVYIHLMPMLTAFCLRWNSEAFRASYPMYKNLSLKLDEFEGGAATYWVFVRPAFVVYGVWWLIYSLWLIFHGLGLPAKGYDTGFNYFNTGNKLGKMVHKMSCKKISEDNIKTTLAFYLFGHFAFIFVPNVSLSYLIFHSYWFNTIWLAVVIIVVIYRGQTYYMS